MARGDSTNGNDSHGSINKKSALDAFKYHDSMYQHNSAPPKPSSTAVFAAPRTGRLARLETNQLSDVCDEMDYPGTPVDLAALRKARKRLDASARNGNPFMVVTCNKVGDVESTCSSNSGDLLFKMRNLGVAPFLHHALPKYCKDEVEHVSTGQSITVPMREPKFSLSQGPGKRSASPLEEMEEDDVENPPALASATLSLRMKDEKEIEAFYDKTFQLGQQVALKAILKAWIKELEPCKQKNYPYSGDKAPPWWPKDCTHKEPDHILKPERQKVALAIIRAVQDHDSLTIDSLKNVTTDKVTKCERDTPEKLQRRKQLLAQLFRVARHEENFLAGELDGDALVTVHDFSITVKTKTRKRPAKKKHVRKESRGKNLANKESECGENQPSSATDVQMRAISDDLRFPPVSQSRKLDTGGDMEANIHASTSGRSAQINRNYQANSRRPEIDSHFQDSRQRFDQHDFDTQTHPPHLFYSFQPQPQPHSISVAQSTNLHHPMSYEHPSATYSSIDSSLGRMEWTPAGTPITASPVMSQNLAATSFSSASTVDDPQCCIQYFQQQPELAMQSNHLRTHSLGHALNLNPVAMGHGLPLQPQQAMAYGAQWDDPLWAPTPAAYHPPPNHYRHP